MNFHDKKLDNLSKIILNTIFLSYWKSVQVTKK